MPRALASAAALVLPFALLSLPGCGDVPEAQDETERREVTVEVRTATPREIPVNVEATGVGESTRAERHGRGELEI